MSQRQPIVDTGRNQIHFKPATTARVVVILDVNVLVCVIRTIGDVMKDKWLRPNASCSAFPRSENRNFVIAGQPKSIKETLGARTIDDGSLEQIFAIDCIENKWAQHSICAVLITLVDQIVPHVLWELTTGHLLDCHTLMSFDRTKEVETVSKWYLKLILSLRSFPNSWNAKN